MKMLITLEPDGILDKPLHTCALLHYSDTGMHNGDEASPSIILAGRGLLVKMLITLEPHGIF